MIYVGVDIGGTKTAAGIVDREGKVLKKNKIATPAAEGGGAVLRASIELVRNLLDSWNEQPVAIGIGAGGQVDCRRGVIVSATDLLPGWAGQPVADRFTASFQIPTFVENDVNALAIGEYMFGSAKTYKTSVFIALGTGVGGALMIDGKLHHGAHWSGGEIGQMIIDFRDSARHDGAGHKGTLEAYASGHGLVASWRAITGDQADMTGEQIAQEAEQDSGSPAALAVAQTGRSLGFGLVSIVSVIDPDLIVIGGGLSLLGDMILGPARSILSSRALPGPSTCPLIVASLGYNSAIVGAAATAMAAYQ
jgi:glucokinase